jgi:hypothetical protein
MLALLMVLPRTTTSVEDARGRTRRLPGAAIITTRSRR